jgi:hypothetical protein
MTEEKALELAAKVASEGFIFGVSPGLPFMLASAASALVDNIYLHCAPRVLFTVQFDRQRGRWGLW